MPGSDFRIWSSSRFSTRCARFPGERGRLRCCVRAVTRDGRSVAIDPRNVLRGVLDDAEKEGYQFHVGTELEFYLLGEDNKPVGDVIQCYSLTAGAPWEYVMRPLRRMLDEFGIYVEACNTEYAPGQFEMNVRYAEAMASADNTLRFKAAVREIASEHGLMATFMPKPFPGVSGNGLHVHQSVLADGTNAFADASGGGVFGNKLMEHYLAGLLEHMPGLMFLGGSSVNSYKRLEEYSFAPMNATWSEDNRTVGIRTIGHGAGRRIEYRGASADANPYLIIAGCIAAGLDGVKNNTVLPPRHDGDAYALGLSLPATLAEGTAAFEVDDVLQGRPRQPHVVTSSRARSPRVGSVFKRGDRLGAGSIFALGVMVLNRLR